MLCDKCKKNVATYHSKTIINGIESSEHLCSDCARELNRSVDFDSFDMFDIFHPSIDFNNDLGIIPNDIFESPFELYQSNNQGIIGNALSSIKKGAQKFSDEKSKIDPEIENLKNQLKEAVDKEDYEKAVELKKEIEKRMKGKGE